MAKIKQFDYEGHTITFEFADGNKMINATEMVKAFPQKRVNDFLRLKNTKEYIIELQKRYENSRNGGNTEVLRVVQGGKPGLQGTWMDEKLALKFAAWLSVDFEIWVYDRIYELLTTGKTELPSQRITSLSIPDALREIADFIEVQDEINEEVRERLSELEAKITSVDDNYYTIAGYCALNKIPCPLHKAKEWGKAATKLSREQEVATGTAHDERFGKVRTYHKDVLGQVVK